MGDITMTHWYDDEKKVIELAEFLVQSVEIVDTEELLEYFKHPDRYTEVWNIYEKEMLGTLSISPDLSKKGKLHELKQQLSRVSKEEHCACGIA
jgi:hypothetical protein